MRTIDLAFETIWEAYRQDSQELLKSKDSPRWAYGRTRVAILAAIRTAESGEDVIETGLHYLPRCNELTVRLIEIGYPSEQAIAHAQKAVKPDESWQARLQGLIDIHVET